ncbi:hypothetical protein B0A54_09362 [Friedmanniomyces endolithicus]|uniref:Uncharacterized protein n=1 Tax=Friedmanniomyces endolithicus TaxID=329885 RepID=A0A4U0UWR5_9PEZI|nr:hypothetical protein LTS09_013542 [Friedmanniomyces endolithicus]TKA40413.1 hypothetical protein B0A54_09362 [Friedmanniomyces endolithicus]
MAGTTCNCGHQMFDSRGCCPACIERRQKRHYLVSSLKSEKAMELPRDQLSSPHKSPEKVEPLSMSPREITRPISPAGIAWNTGPISHGESKHGHVLPAHLYPSPGGIPTTAVSTLRPGRTSTIQHSEDHIGSIVSRLARPAMPIRGTSGLGLQDYPPMATSLTRISRGNMRNEAAVDE